MLNIKLKFGMEIHLFSLNNAINPVYILRLLNNVDDERIQDAVRQIENELIKKFKDINERD